MTELCFFSIDCQADFCSFNSDYQTKIAGIAQLISLTMSSVYLLLLGWVGFACRRGYVHRGKVLSQVVDYWQTLRSFGQGEGFQLRHYGLRHD